MIYYIKNSISKLRKNLLITGGVGFIGINATKEFLLNDSFEKLIILDLLKYGQNIEKISIFEDKRIIFINGDINDKELVNELLAKHEITHIAHLAAESHVDYSITNPNEFVYSNINGTFNLLEAFRLHWNTNGNLPEWRFLYLSTDEVFGSLDEFDNAFDESSNHNPSSPYSASKSSAEQLAKAWNKTYNMPILIINCTNNYGPYQYSDKLIPVIIKSILKGEKIPLYGNGKNIRDWIHVKDHCKAIRMILEKGIVGNSYCVGSDSEISNLDLIKIVCDQMDEFYSSSRKEKSFSLLEFTKDRLGHDFRYSVNSKKIRDEIGWSPKYKLKEGLQDTISWFLNNKFWLEMIKI